MNDLTKYQAKLPVNYQRHLAKHTNHMESIARLTIEALGTQSNIYSYTVFETFRTLTTIAALKQAFPAHAMSPESEAILNGLIQDYLTAMQKIPQEACRMILNVLENVSAPQEEEGFLDTIINAFFARANE